MHSEIGDFAFLPTAASRVRVGKVLADLSFQHIMDIPLYFHMSWMHEGQVDTACLANLYRIQRWGKLF